MDMNFIVIHQPPMAVMTRFGCQLLREKVFRWFLREALIQACPQRGSVHQGPQRRFKIEFAVITKAGPQFTVCGQPDLIACVAEMEIGQRTDKSHDGPRLTKPIIFGRTMSQFRFHRLQGILRRKQIHYLADGKKIFFAQHFSETYGHKFDEADGNLQGGGELDQGPDLIFVFMPNQDGVEFDGFKAERFRRAYAGKRAQGCRA